MDNLKPVSAGRDITVAIIQARMGASRLPGKVLEVIEEQPMLWYVVERTSLASSIDRVIVATTREPADDSVANWCEDNRVSCYRGSEADVLDRYYQAAKESGATRVIRITADCPLTDPAVIDQVVSEFCKVGADYASNSSPYSWPDGLDVEVFSFAVLERAWQEASRKTDREHVTPFMRSDSSVRSISVEGAVEPDVKDWRLTVDHPDDLAYIRAIFRQFPGRWDVPFCEVETLIRDTPEKLPEPPGQIHVANEGHYKSIYQEAEGEIAPRLTIEQSEALFTRVSKVIPGGAQTFSKSHLQHIRGVSPLFLDRGEGARVWDVDGNQYIDYIQGLLPNILGYAHKEVNAAFTDQLARGHSFSLPHPLELTLAERLCELIPCAEMVRFGKNGSDATAGAVRIARAFTGRDRIACCGYHGWQDWFIGSTTRNGGVPEAVRELTHPFPYNDTRALEAVLSAHAGEFAAVIMEPFNFTEPDPGYLKKVKQLAHDHGAILVFDEICSGFHFGLGGAQKLFGVTPDLACFGKAMANGFPLSAVVGRREVMNICEDVFFSFTFGGEVASMAATLKVLDILENTPVLDRIAGFGRQLQDGLNTLARLAGLDDRIACTGRPSWALLQFSDADGNSCLTTRSLFQQEVVKRGILILCTHNLSGAHTDSQIDRTLECYAAALKTIEPWLRESDPCRFIEGEPVQPVFQVRS
ncbi:MAG: aminotransferase class III-fold pyridoxal phosphate-dependent enzyme [Verrucomicrobiales bacterium]|nr:aminotransferase class III-fold pyridoxal phosphate-dependent enzyme [Verrucomicrobiales bacterium]